MVDENKRVMMTRLNDACPPARNHDSKHRPMTITFDKNHWEKAYRVDV